MAPVHHLFRPHFQTRRPGIQARKSQSADGAGPPRCSTQRAGIAPPHAEGDGLSGVTSDGETFAFISVPASFVGGVPLTRAMIPWAMPEASTKRPVLFPCELIPLSEVKVDPGKSAGLFITSTAVKTAPGTSYSVKVPPDRKNP